ncbi:MAG: polyketide beta-ketoacyl:ACP synthase [Algicola sp.]|nr:polyketide beta-ketoacyl:ACP synthase [Algicola sp.]
MPDSETSETSDMVVTGLGVTSSIGQGKTAFITALLAGEHKFDVMKRPGRQSPDGTTAFFGAEIGDLTLPDTAPRNELRTASLSAKVALATLDEAWNEAHLSDVDPKRIGLVVGGSNFQQRELLLTQQKYHNKLDYLRPTYAMSFMDSDLCGLCTQTYGIRGLAYTMGGASASGQACIIQAIEAVRSGQVDVCIALGALMDLSYWECQGFRSLGAMGSDNFAEDPGLACRPFDRDRNGFIYGENCGALVIERSKTATRTGVKPYARLAGWAMEMDGNRNPNPSFEGEVSVIKQALKQAQLSPGQIDYINPHGTGSTIGDETELSAIAHCGLRHARINATKSVIGHGLSAAGAIEMVATLLQMRTGQLHPSRNLDNPMAADYDWVRRAAVEHNIENALKMSMGFGGINTAICLQKY